MTERTDAPVLADPGEAARQRQLVGRVARGGTLNLLGTGVAAVLMFAQSVIVARGVSTTAAGVFFSVTSVAVILTTVAAFGADWGLPRFLPMLRTQGRSPDAERTIGVATVVAVGVAALLGVVLLLLPDSFSGAVGLADDASDARSMMWLLAGCLPFAALASVWVAATRGYLAIRPTVVLEKVGKTALQTAGMLLAVALGASASWLVAAWLVPTAVLCVPALVWLRRIAVRARPSLPAQGPAQQPGVARDYLGYTWPRAVQSILQIALQRLDVVIVAATVSAGQAALYALATRFIVLGQFAQGALQQVVAPHLSQLFAEDRTRAVVGLARTVTVWSVLLVWPVYLVSIWGGVALLRVFGGSQYTAGATALAILAAGMLFASLTGPVDTILLMAGRSWLSMTITAVALTIDVSLLLLLVPRLGIDGAALAWCAAVVTRSGLSLAFARQTTGTWTFSRPLGWACGLAMGAMLAVPAAIERALPGGGLGSSTIALCLAAALYVLAVWALRERLDLAWPRGGLRRPAQPRPAPEVPENE